MIQASKTDDVKSLDVKKNMQNGDLLLVCLNWFFIFLELPWIWLGKNYLYSRLKSSKNLCQTDVNSEMHYVAWKLL